MYLLNDDRVLLCRVSTFGNLRVKRIFAPYRSLSQLITSFIGNWCQGIRPMLLLAWPMVFGISNSNYLSYLFSLMFQLTFPVTFNFKKDLILLIAFALDIQIIYLYSIQLSKFIDSHMLSWWRWGESNSWPPACKAGALPAELHPRIKVKGNSE